MTIYVPSKNNTLTVCCFVSELHNMEFKALSLECTYHRLLIFIQWNKSWDNFFPGAGACKSCAEPVTIWNSKWKHIWLHYSRQCQSGQYSLQICVLISWIRKNPHPQAKEVLFRWSLYAFQYNCITKRCFFRVLLKLVWFGENYR